MKLPKNDSNKKKETETELFCSKVLIVKNEFQNTKVLKKENELLTLKVI